MATLQQLGAEYRDRLGDVGFVPTQEKLDMALHAAQSYIRELEARLARVNGQ